MGLWKGAQHTPFTASAPITTTFTKHTENNYELYPSASKRALGTKVTKRIDPYSRFKHGEWKEQGHYRRQDTSEYLQNSNMNDGRGIEAPESIPSRESPLKEGNRSRENIYGSEQDQSRYRSREELEYVGPRSAKFIEDLEDVPLRERLSEGSHGEIRREAAGEGHTGNDRVVNHHGPLYDVPLENDTRQPDQTLPTSPKHSVGRSLTPRSEVSSLHEERASHWERRPASRPATEPTVPQPTALQPIKHVESQDPLPGFEPVRPSPKSFPSRVYTALERFFQRGVSSIKRKFTAHPIITSISLLLILLALIFFIYLLTRFIPWVVHLLKLKAYIDSKLALFDEWKGKIDEFKDQVVGKFRDWLGDGKALADNVKDKVKEKVNSGIDKVNGVVGKLGVKVGYVDRRDVVGPAGVIGVAGRAMGRRGVVGNLGTLWNVVHDGKAETMAVTSEVTTTTATSWEPRSTWRSSTVVLAIETNSAIARRGNIPLPFVLLGGLASLARGEEHFSKVSDAIGTTLLGSQATPTLATATVSTEYTSASTTTPDLHHTGPQVREPGGDRGSGSGSGSGSDGNQKKDKTPEPGYSNNHTSSALGHRAYLPYPILILGNMLRYARAEIVNPIEKFPPASTAALSSITGAASALRPRQKTYHECMLANSLDEFIDCCRLIEDDPIQLDVCVLQLRIDPHFPINTIKPVKRFTNEEADSHERPQGLEEHCTKEAGRMVCDKHRRGEPWGGQSSIEQTGYEVHPRTETMTLASTTTVIHEVTKRDESSETGASGGAKEVFGESLVSSTVLTTSTAVASADEERIKPTSTETANLAPRRFGGLSWW